MQKVEFIKDCKYCLDGINAKQMEKGQIVEVSDYAAGGLIRSGLAKNHVELKKMDEPLNKMVDTSKKINKKKGKK